MYTIMDVEVMKGQLVIFAESGDGEEIVIRPRNFKNYERI
jgi:hypothetical protein